MELFSSILLVALAIVVAVYCILTEGLDWVGRAKVISRDG